MVPSTNDRWRNSAEATVIGRAGLVLATLVEDVDAPAAAGFSVTVI
jgi:hypothetical protein